MAKIKTPYAALLPPLSTEEREALKQSIKAEGVRDAIHVTEDGILLDGYNRHSIDPDAPRYVIPNSSGWSEAQHKAYIWKVNFERRNLSPEQKEEVNKLRREVALDLRSQGLSQKAIALSIGACQQTVSNWLRDTTTNGSKPVSVTPKIVVPREEHETIAERIEAGETQAQVAADYGVSQQNVSKIVQAVERDREREAAETSDRRDQNKRIKIATAAELKDEIGYRLAIVGVEWLKTDWLTEMSNDCPLVEKLDADCLLFFLTDCRNPRVGQKCEKIIADWKCELATRYFAIDGTEKFNGEPWENVIVGYRGKVPIENIVPRARAKCLKDGIEATLLAAAMSWLKDSHSDKRVVHFAGKIVVPGCVNWSLDGKVVAA